MKSRNPKNGWTPNWVGRGVTLVNRIEKMAVSKPKETAPLVTNDKSYIKRLRELLIKFPQNEFYKNLAKQLVKKTALTVKQVGCINSDYDEYILTDSIH